MAGDGNRSGSGGARVVRLLTALALATGAAVAAATAASAQSPPPGGSGSVGQTLTVVVPPHDPVAPPGGPGPGGIAGPGPATPDPAGRSGRQAAPVVAAVPSGALPRTGVGPWFWPTVLAALALVVVGAVLSSIGGRLGRRAPAWVGAAQRRGAPQ